MSRFSLNGQEQLCEVCERGSWDVGEMCFTEFNTWECDGPGSCHEQSLRLTYGDDTYPFGGGTEPYVHGNKL